MEKKRNRLILKKNQRVILPCLTGTEEKERKAKVIQDCYWYYIVQARAGYKECIPAFGETGVKI